MSFQQFMDKQSAFLYSEFFTLTLMGTVQHNKIYKDDVAERERKAFQIALQQKLIDISKQYKKPVPGPIHELNITQLADQLTASQKAILFKDRFRIGTAQKALNLFLKYLWCAGEVVEPPHCPFDFLIIQKLPSELHDIKWTQVDDIGIYRKLVEAAKACAAPLSLAEWELSAWNS